MLPALRSDNMKNYQFVNARRKMDCTQQEIAYLADVAIMTVWRSENGRSYSRILEEFYRRNKVWEESSNALVRAKTV